MNDVAPQRTVIDTPVDDLRDHFRRLTTEGYRLALVAGHHDAAAMRVVYLLVTGPPDTRVELHVSLDPGRPEVPSLADLSFPANRFERELRDLFGIEPMGHQRPARLVLHQHWPEGWHPMRADAGAAPEFGDESQAYPFLTVEGPGVYEIPVGPVHAGLIEPGHFRFSVVGETILRMKARLWFVHKGIERLFQGRDAAHGIELAERVSGDTAVGHTLAYCLAVEEACAVEVPPGARAARAVLLELERLYNHVADIGALCNDVGFGVVHAHALRIRERLLRLNAVVTGHRLLRGGVILGGATVHTLPTVEVLDDIHADFHEIVEIALANPTVVDRFTGTAVLTSAQAIEIGALGYVARASGLDMDARRAHPMTGLYRNVEIPVQSGGDVLARFAQRVAEVDASIALLHELLAHVDAGSYTASNPDFTAVSHGVGLVEGWRGTIAHRVELASDGTLRRVKVVDPSFFNWPAVPISLNDTIVPDFPLANKSFNLSYAGNDL